MYPNWNPTPNPLLTQHLPTGSESPDWCELSERVNELPRRTAILETIRYLLNLVLLAAVIGILPRSLMGHSPLEPRSIWLTILAIQLGVVFVHFLAGSRLLRYWVLLTGLWVVLGSVIGFQAEAPNGRIGYVILFPIAVSVSCVLAYFIATQFAYYAAANLNNEWFVSDAWRCEWSEFESGRHLSLRSELPQIHRALLGIVVAIAVGGFVNYGFGYGPIIFLLVLVLLTPIFWTKDADPVECVSAAWRAVEVFLTYERRPCEAPGVFRFPTRSLRSHPRRLCAVLAALVLVAVTTGTMVPAKWPSPPVYDRPERAPLPPEVQPVPSMTRAELAHYDRIASVRGEQAKYLTLLRLRRTREASSFRDEEKKHSRTVLTTAVACVLTPPAVVFGTLVFLFGPALAAYRRNLDARPQE